MLGKSIYKKIKPLKNRMIRNTRSLLRFFIRNARRIGRWFIRCKRKISRFFIRVKRTKGKNILEQLSVLKRNLGYRLFTDKNFYASIQDQIRQIPESNGCRYYQPYPYKIAIIADEFLYASFCGIADFVYITPENYREFRDQVDFLLVVSAWRGLHNEWRQMGTVGSPANLVLHEAISYYKEGRKKVVFYSKEDPPNYQHFLPIAQRCDVIFTSAAEKISCYKKDCGNEKVYSLKFGINPAYHNPVGIRKFPKRKEVIFSGSWVKKYPDRIRSLATIFDGVIASGRGLKIIDRNYNLNSPGFFFPAKYDRYISPSINHDDLQKAHKLFDWAININSVTGSHTMFANRVYELQAAGNLMLSNESLGVEEQFNEVIIVHDRQDVVKALTSYDEEDVYLHQMACVRRVMTGETTFDRVGELLYHLGYDISQPSRKVIVILRSESEALRQQFSQQTYPFKELRLWQDMSEQNWPSDAMVTVWDSRYQYGEHYLEDMINGFKYTDCDYICKDAWYFRNTLSEGIEHDYVHSVRNIYAAVFWNHCISYSELCMALEKGSMKKENGYSIDHFNLIQEV